ncbi:MAG: STAS domain-containing protein [Kouleothrix sp.]
MLPLLPGVLLVPIIGTLDSRRELQMHEQLLNSITQARAQVVLLDITGVPIVDIQVASALLEMLREVRLLGCQMIMVGIRPEIAQALVSLGIDLTELTTRAALEDGLTAALGMIGRAIVTRR